MTRTYEILPEQLYVTARTHRLSLEQLQELLATYHITAIVNLWHTIDLTAQSEVTCYLHHPLTDGRRLRAEPLCEAAHAVATLVRRNFQVLLHCYGGRNRSGTVAALALRELYGWTGAQALAYVRERRPRAVGNATFERYLMALDAPHPDSGQ